MKTPAPNSCETQLPSAPRFEAVTLRVATSKDAAMLALVSAATFLEAFTWMLPGADIVEHCARNLTPEAYAAYLAKPTTHITLAVTGDDAPVGYVMVCEPDFPSFDVQPGDTELKRIYLFSRFRGSHVGQALMDTAIASARELGRSRLLLGTHPNNARAIAFYRRNGFAEVGTRTFLAGTLVCCDLIFGRDL